MAPKNKKKNGFYFFMREIKEREARRGVIISMAELPKEAHPKWKKMSLAEKEPYEEMARQYNKDPALRGGKLASDGTRVEDNLIEEQLQIQAVNQMKQNIKHFCNPTCLNDAQVFEMVPKKLFYIMHFNLFVHIEDDDMFIPVEVGIVEYSVHYGIHRQYHKIIYPGPPPTGYTGQAKENSDTKHEICIFGEECSERRLDVVYDEIIAFLCPTGTDEVPPVFSKKDEMIVTKGCLDWLCQRLRRENPFVVWNVTWMLMELMAGARRPVASETIASDLLTKTSFDYHPSTRCDFHEEKDNHCCALSYSKKICYLLSDALCPVFNVELTERHIPTRAIEEKTYTVHQVKNAKSFCDLKPIKLDRTDNYYQNTQTEEDKQAPPKAPRQPQSTCIAEQMTRLKLQQAPATLPGHGIGRGIRRN